MKKQLFFTVLLMLVSLQLNSQTIVVDGAKADWANVPILTEPGVFPYGKVYVSTDSVYYMMETQDVADKHFDYTLADFMQAYIDADRSTSTGHVSGWFYTAAGIDYITSNVISYFNKTGTQQDWNFPWNWVPIDLVGNNVIGEAGFLKSKLLTVPGQPVASQIPLVTNFGLGFTFKVGGQAENYTQPNDWNFSNRNLYSVKPRTVTSVETTAELLSGNAYYHPFMNDLNINQYLDFQSALWSAQNPLHWASWAIDLKKSTKFDVKFTCKCDDGGKIQFCLVDMATNQVVKTFPEIWYTVSASNFIEESLGQLDLTDVPVGKYMLKMNNNTIWAANLKVQKLTVSESSSTGLIQTPINNILIRTGANLLSVQSNKLCDIAVYTPSGAQVTSLKGITNSNINLHTGTYLVLVTVEGKKYSQKVMIK